MASQWRSRREDAARDGGLREVLGFAGVADQVDVAADRQGRAVCERCGLEPVRKGAQRGEVDNGQVGEQIAPDDRRVDELAAVGEGDAHGVVGPDDVRVGQHVAGRDEDAGAGRERRLDEGDRRGDARVDLARGHAPDRRDGLGFGRSRRRVGLLAAAGRDAHGERDGQRDEMCAVRVGHGGSGPVTKRRAKRIHRSRE